jgi:hypothetical protein
MAPLNDDETITDPQVLIQLGMALVLDKPLLITVRPGTPLSRKVRMVADEIVELDLSTEQAKAQSRAAMDKAMKRILTRRGLI